jgi:hypothetical protein
MSSSTHVSPLCRKILPYLNQFDSVMPDRTGMDIGGSTLEAAFEQTIVCMFNYMTDVDAVEVDPSCHRELTVTGLLWFPAYLVVTLGVTLCHRA